MSQLKAFLDTQIEAGLIPGAVALVGHADRDDVEVHAVGDMALGGPRLQADAIMRIQSMTKPITAVATLLHVQAARLDLDDAVDRWLPELADRRVLRTPDADLDDTEPSDEPIRIRHLLTNTSGYGIVFGATPLARAIAESGLEAGSAPSPLGADEWLARLGELPLVGRPGRVFRYHHSFAVLGILLQRLAGEPLQKHLSEAVFDPLGMVDTGLWVPTEKAQRLPAAYRHDDDGTLVETEPLAGGPYLGVPPVDVAHGELVSTAADVHRFARMLADGGSHGGRPFLDPGLVAQLTSDQVAESAKTPDSFFPEFWDGMGWGFGVAVQTAGDHRGRYGWSGGQGTDWFTDPDGTMAILLTQVELGPRTWSVIEEFQRIV